MRLLRVISKGLLLVVAVWGFNQLSLTSTTSSSAAPRVTVAALSDSPCHCSEEKDLALSNAESSKDDCEHNAQVQLDNCLLNADQAWNDAFNGCMDWAGWEFGYISWCANAAQQAYANYAATCYDTVYNYLMPYCDQMYDRAVEAADDAYHHCQCNCVDIEDKSGLGC